MRRIVMLAMIVVAGLLSLVQVVNAADKPNVILIITDDQGYGDVGAHGNTMIQTPHLDKMHSESVRLTDYHVDPTCSPTRSALMSGRYSTRTGVWHTINGRSIIHGDELLLPKVFERNGYRTGMFGKWHLGDNHPSRPQDVGFDVATWHGGGGVGQTPDHWGNDYFDDTYWVKGKAVKQKGYCTDVWFKHATSFIKDNARRPFFCYISTNAPHGPFYVEEKYSKPYLERGVSERMAKFYGMITNIDENIGKLRRFLSESGLADNTILIFTTDNGTAAGVAGKNTTTGWQGFNAGMRGQKGSSFDGGHRVPLYMYWPKGGVMGGRDVDTLSAHIDVLPTLVELCGIKKPKGPAIDGVSFAKLFKYEDAKIDSRTLFVHSQRVEHVKKWRNFAVMTERWRLLTGGQLYDIVNDPGQQKDVAKENKAVLKELTEAYDGWWKHIDERVNNYVRVDLGHPKENPARLTCHDWHEPKKGVPWNQTHVQNENSYSNGFWTVNVVRDGRYKVSLRRWDRGAGKPMKLTAAELQLNDKKIGIKDIPVQTDEVWVEVELKAGPMKLGSELTYANGKTGGAYYVFVEYLGR